MISNIIKDENGIEYNMFEILYSYLDTNGDQNYIAFDTGSEETNNVVMCIHEVDAQYSEPVVEITFVAEEPTDDILIEIKKEGITYTSYKSGKAKDVTEYMQKSIDRNKVKYDKSMIQMLQKIDAGYRELYPESFLIH